MEQAAEIAQVWNLSQKPKGYQEELAEGGGNFSGGQSNAGDRASVIRCPEIYIFDDSFLH